MCPEPASVPGAVSGDGGDKNKLTSVSGQMQLGCVSIPAEPFPLAVLELMSWTCFHPLRQLLSPGCLKCVAELPHAEGVAVHEYVC